MRLLTQFDWPGNVRELQNVIERAVVLTTGPALTVENLPEEIRNKTATTASVDDGEMELAFNIGTPLDSIELQIIQKTLEHFEGNRRAAAESLGIAERTIYRKLKGMEEAAVPPPTEPQVPNP
jgi:two-component system response regulator HydG